MRFRLSLLLALLLPFAASAAPDAPVEGTDYYVIEGGAPYAPLAGKIEVVEIFGYWCHHCADFQPKVEAWKAKLPKDVRFTYLPLPNGNDDAFARAYFASLAAGTLTLTHDATFVAIHDEHTLPKNPTMDELATFYGERGANAARLRALMDSPAVVAKLAPARAWAMRIGLEGTPTLVVNGKYRVDGGTLEDRLRVASQLIARERAAKARR
ncbi:thiol:disulfide interchange protein DsbA/DsbL [Lysobacter solisilvae (ex Woo and Kim 2020)]|uniref:Thiol:disulfide interchange protein n=1 Tax=Agrilutibacter terrestris TaxID=2865112 RepID=A0A7H0G0H2_9GAMM|nr:thiol:disulfide interchange protein DsbA/DsbL [Lysobacter terrestris]QNP41788.1 thiol:disulfide interchange protein DsbA/DsbL [Lysobacter terrestris]